MAVAECGSIKCAADSLSLTPSPVSRLISELEDLCSTKLFERNRDGLKLTKTGKELHHQIWPHYTELVLLEKEFRKKSFSHDKIHIYFSWATEGEVLTLFNLLQEIGVSKNVILSEQNHSVPHERQIEFDGKIFISEEKMVERKLNLAACFKHEGFSIVKQRNIKSNDFLVSHKQMSNKPFREFISKIKSSQCDYNFFDIESHSLFKDMILQGVGAGVMPTIFNKMPLWRDLSFININIDDLPLHNVNVYVPDKIHNYRFHKEILSSIGRLTSHPLLQPLT